MKKNETGYFAFIEAYGKLVSARALIARHKELDEMKKKIEQSDLFDKLHDHYDAKIRDLRNTSLADLQEYRECLTGHDFVDELEDDMEKSLNSPISDEDEDLLRSRLYLAEIEQDEARHELEKCLLRLGVYTRLLSDTELLAHAEKFLPKIDPPRGSGLLSFLVNQKAKSP